MLDAMQDYHFWFKLAAFILLLFSTLSTVLMPYQCSTNETWFKFLQMHSSPAFLLIFFCILCIYVFGEYPSSCFCLSLDFLGAVIIGCTGFIELFATYIALENKEDCFFNITFCINLLIFVLLLTEGCVYLVVGVMKTRTEEE